MGFVRVPVSTAEEAWRSTKKSEGCIYVWILGISFGHFSGQNNEIKVCTHITGANVASEHTYLEIQERI